MSPPRHRRVQQPHGAHHFVGPPHSHHHAAPPPPHHFHPRHAAHAPPPHGPPPPPPPLHAMAPSGSGSEQFAPSHSPFGHMNVAQPPPYSPPSGGSYHHAPPHAPPPPPPPPPPLPLSLPADSPIGEKIPLNFKEFVERRVKDNSNPKEAMKRFEEYLRKFGKTKEQLFVNKHENEEWFKEKYDPATGCALRKEKDGKADERAGKWWRKVAANGREINEEMCADLKEDEKEDYNSSVIGKLNEIVNEMKKGEDEEDERQIEDSHCVFIGAVPLNLKRGTLRKVFDDWCKKAGDFAKVMSLRMSDPIRLRNSRFAWIELDSESTCQLAMRAHCDGGLDGARVTETFFLRLLPKEKSKRRAKLCPTECLKCARIERDLKQCTEVVRLMDERAGVKSEKSVLAMLDHLPGDVCKLNALLSYLRCAHWLCYYCGEEFLKLEQMWAKCAMPHVRKARDWISEEGGVWDAEWSPFERALDEKHSQMMQREHDDNWLQSAQRKVAARNTKKVSEGKHRCRLCKKLFKGEAFVHKHLRNRHADEMDEAVDKLRSAQTLSNYLADSDRIDEQYLSHAAAAASDRPFHHHSHHSHHASRGRRRGGGRGASRRFNRSSRYHHRVNRTLRSYSDVRVDTDDSLASSAHIDYGFGDASADSTFGL